MKTAYGLKSYVTRLAKRAVEGTDYACLQDTFKGPSIIAFSTEHPGAGARILQDFAKGNDDFELKAAAFEGEVVDVSQCWQACQHTTKLLLS